jgi:RNA polymerase sigma-70 factor (ECF subfamily)
MVSLHPDEHTESGIQRPTIYRSTSVVQLAEEPESSYPPDSETNFISIYNEYYPFAFFIAKSFVDTEDAGDIVADVFGRLWKKRADLSKIENFKSYITVSIRHACLDHLGRESNRRKKVNDYSEHSLEMLNGEYLKEEIQAEKLHRIYLEVEKLPRRCREIFKLAFIEGLANSVIAQKMGISTRTVINHKSYAIRTLRLILLQVSPFFLLHIFP